MTSFLPRLLAALFLTSAALHGQATEFLDRLMATRAIDPDASALVITDLATGEVVDSLNLSKSLIPASIMKCSTTGALLPHSGCGYRYETQVAVTGKIKDGILDGNLVVTGSGDPSVNAGCEPAGPDLVSETVKALQDLGVKDITGEILVDGSVFPGPAVPPSWAAADTRHKYGTGCHGFNFRHNASGSTAVSDPASVFRTALAQALSKAGITLHGEKKDGRRRNVIFTHRSASIDEIMRSCMMRSDNLFAEALLRTIALTKGKSASTEEAAKLETLHWKQKGLPMEGVTIIDGSGLSRQNRVTASFLEGVLADMASDPDYASFFPLAGQEGTLKNFLKDTDLDSYLALKTGSMTGIQCYAGYKLDDDFVPTHAIVVILNSLPKGRPAARAALETYFLNLFAE